MTNAIEYVINLRSGKAESDLDRIDRKASGLNMTMGGLARTMAGVVTAFGAYSFIEGSIRAWNESEQSLAQLNATLKSTGGAVGVSVEAMQAQAKAMQQLTVYDDDAVVGMQAVLATFTNIRGEIFTNAVPAILDLSTKMGQDLKGSAVQVGKALQDPIQGITALRRVGVNFSDAQQGVIKNLVETNRLGEAQAMILRELQVEFGGSAMAAAQAGTGPFKQLQNDFNDVREAIGKLTFTIGKGMLPALKAATQYLGQFFEWANNNVSTVKALAGGVATFTGALYVARTAVTAFGVSSGALVAAGGPLTLLLVALGAIAAAYIKVQNAAADAAKAWEDERNARNANIEGGANWVMQNALKGEMQRGKSEKQARKEIAAKALELAQQKREEQRRKMNEAANMETWYPENKDYWNAEKAKYAQDVVDYDRQIAAAKAFSVMPKKARPPLGNGAGAPMKDPMKTQATGSKAVTINVTIGDLIKTFNIHTTNLREGARSVKEQVQGALMGAVNDFQIVAER